ncbi:DUF192 domain-containing protein [Pollutimonas harenae]
MQTRNTLYKAMLRSASLCWLTLVFFLAPPVHAQGMLLPTTQIKVGPQTVQAEVAATDASRSYGLMNRQSLPTDHGMLFVFDSVGMPCFWMKNTPLPLSIAFIDAQGMIVNIADMQPHSLDTHCPAAAIVFALEMEQGWFKRHQIKAGMAVKQLPQR